MITFFIAMLPGALIGAACFVYALIIEHRGKKLLEKLEDEETDLYDQLLGGH